MATAVSSFDQRWKGSVRLFLAGLICFATACSSGGPSPAGSMSSSPRATPVTPSSSRSVTSTVPGYPNLSKFANPIDRFGYKSAYDTCLLLGLKGAAEAYGGESADPASVARAFANATYSQETSYREAAFQGCLDALRVSATSPGS
jgi:hypothetical protein